jgi:hypothetical protein
MDLWRDAWIYGGTHGFMAGRMDLWRDAWIYGGTHGCMQDPVKQSAWCQFLFTCIKTVRCQCVFT